MVLQETFVITDYVWYWKGTTSDFDSGGVTSDGWLYRSSTGDCKFNTSINLPSKFQLSYKFKKTDASNYSVYATLGSDNGTNNYDVGNLASSRMIIRKNNNSALLIDRTNAVTSNTEYTVVYEYDNGLHKLNWGGDTYTATDSSVSMDKLFSFTLRSSGYIKDMKIKAL